MKTISLITFFSSFNYPLWFSFQILKIAAYASTSLFIHHKRVFFEANGMLLFKLSSLTRLLTSFFDSFSRLHHCMLIASWPRLFFPRL
jgi:hypothetical protein